ncbi:cupin domain-containing protein [Spiractinospora alimapuensis]|uniref:cupin domain-containing protein n=1 Tax=Spiractinospora alimapuensis TaxID=2820884 RepID=UPI001F306F41|nr:cupin domain-containing protein [Spiractinospora alimapuensis]QVQ51177.1 cupin domain-containing protein [Spiractinospora alimapuensis]
MERYRFGEIDVVVRLELPRLSVVDLEVSPGVVAPAHRHAGADEVFLGVEGVLRVTVDGREVVLEPGSAVTATGGQAHGFSTEDGAARATVIYAPGEFLGYFRDAALATTPEEFDEVLRRWDVHAA